MAISILRSSYRRRAAAHRVAALLVAAILCSHVAGCGERAADGGSLVGIRDSAGVAIVETRAQRASASELAAVAAQPNLTIGPLNGDPRYDFTGISGVVRTPDGGLVVADRGSYSLRFFDSSGVFTKEVGRRGEGPEEFVRLIIGAHRCGDGTIVVSEVSARAGWWSLDGRFLGRARFVLPAGANPALNDGGVTRPLYSACSPNGHIIMASWGDPTKQPSVETLKEQTAVSYPTWSRLWLVDTAGTIFHEFPDTIIAERIMHHSSGGGGGSGPHMFGRNIAFAMDTSRLFVSYGGKLEVAIYSFDGKLTGLWRAPVEDLSFTDAMKNRYETATLPQPDSLRRARYVPRYVLTYPDTYPAFDALHLTRDGYLWARRYRLPWEGTVRWGVFDPNGRFLGYSVFPQGLEVFEIHDDYVVGVMKDSLDVPIVQLHGITLPARGK